ncbi:MAG: MmcQ/YjbR family DNA-binding protein [Saprospiraceae bacterium]|nr:MmcQ/YjbR family DNA-binding protein [Saprospiraceae bacterium]
MNVEEVRAYCLLKPHTTEGFPFDEQTLVFKVAGKMFALTGLEWEQCHVNLKCDPERSLELREQYPEIVPGYHMSKKHWNTVAFEAGLSEDFLKELIDHSYELVVGSFSKKKREELGL